MQMAAMQGIMDNLSPEQRQELQESHGATHGR